MADKPITVREAPLSVRPPSVPMPEPPEICRNCLTPLQGEFCSECGQREGRGDVHLSDVASELVDDFLHWDSRIWRTLFPLMFRPGFLTAEFIAGRKARYVPPLRLYLMISFALFIVLSLEVGNVVIEASNAPGDQAAGAQSDQLRREAAGGAEPDAEPGENVGIASDLRPMRPADVEQAEERGETVIAPFLISSDDAAALDEAITIDLADKHSPRWLVDLEQRLEENADRLSEDPESFVRALIEYLPQMMFLLLPLFALLIKCCYLFSGFHYLQHLVFSLHFHSFVYLLSMLGSLAEWLMRSDLNSALIVLIVLYLPLALKRAYGSGLVGAVGKSMIIVAFDSILLAIGFAFVAIVTLALM